MELAEARAQGPSPSFGAPQFVLAFLAIGSSGTVGRAALAKKAGLGEGAVRTVLKRLRAGGYAEADASGCHLTESGTRVYRTLERELKGPILVHGSRLTVGRIQAALSIRGGGRLVMNGIEQRDSAVKAGASGATTYVMKGRAFTIPGGSRDCEADFPSPAWDDLRGQLRPREGDAVVLCGSSDEATATLGALSAALTLI
jgi:hypothetical protein